MAEEDVNSSSDSEDGTATASAAVFGGNFGARKEELAAADAADAATLLFEAPSSCNRGNGTKEGKREGTRAREEGQLRRMRSGGCGRDEPPSTDHLNRRPPPKEGCTIGR